MTEDEDFDFVPRTTLEKELADELRKRVLSEDECIRFTMVRHQGLGPSKESLRPLSISGVMQWQLEQSVGKQVIVKNYSSGDEAQRVLDSLLDATGAREYHLTASTGDLHIRITRKGRALVSRGTVKGDKKAVGSQVKAHDHIKDQPLSRFDSTALLKVLGLADGGGNIKASMRGKTDQINAFLRELDALLDEDSPSQEKPLEILDCGCGRAYLTLSAYCYLSQVRGLKVKVSGVDRNQSVITSAKGMAERLGIAGDVEFITADLAEVKLDTPPDLVLSLQACDVATDLAIACGIRLGARYMLIAPCCQHDLQKQIKDSGPMRALLRHGILRERLADLMTDAFRAQLMRISGYRVKISEFVSSEATARNIMLRAVKGVKAGQPQVVSEYLEMRDEWHVVPVLETILGEKVQRYFQ